MNLTARQLFIARAIARGDSYAAIGAQLKSPKHPDGITGGVVRNYARTIAEKIDNPAELSTRAAIKLWVVMEDRKEQRRAG